LSESPPSSKKLLRTPGTRLRQMLLPQFQEVRLDGILRAPLAVALLSARFAARWRNALRSTLPFGVNGNASRNTHRRGRMGTGSRSLTHRRSSCTSRSLSAPGTARTNAVSTGLAPLPAPCPHRPRPPLHALHNGAQEPAPPRLGRTGKPLMFNWKSFLPNISIIPSGRKRPRSPVRYRVFAVTGCTAKARSFSSGSRLP
jgi:hypothetical protein